MALSVHFTLFFCLLLFSDVEPNSVVFYANNTLRIEGNRFSITLPPSPISLIVKRNVTTISTNRSHSHNCDIIVTWWRLICETYTTRCRCTPEPRSRSSDFFGLLISACCKCPWRCAGRCLVADFPCVTASRLSRLTIVLGTQPPALLAALPALTGRRWRRLNSLHQPPSSPPPKRVTNLWPK